MKRTLPHITMALVLLTAGVLVGRAISFRAAEHAGSSTGNTVEIAPDRPGRGVAREAGDIAAGDTHDLAGLARRLEMIDLPERDQLEISRMATPALRGMVSALLVPAHREDGVEMESGVRSPLLEAAVAELYRRDGLEALAWMKGVDGNISGWTGLGLMLGVAGKESPDAALAWFRAQGERILQDSTLRNALGTGIAQGAVERGADELVRVIGLIGADEVWNFRPGSMKYPADFDFAKAMPFLPVMDQSQDFFGYWAARDPEAAWRGMSVVLEDEYSGTAFRMVTLGAVGKMGEEAGVRWAAEKLAELPPGQRENLLGSGYQLDDLTPQGISTLASSLPAADRQIFAATLMRITEDARKAIVVLETLPRAEMLEVLAWRLPPEAYQVLREDIGGETSATLRIYKAVIRHFSLTPGDLRAMEGLRESE